MIYLDNAATTYPKPPGVQQSLSTSLYRFGANPGRSGYAMALKTSEEIYKCRKLIQTFFNADEPENVIFTPSCTFSVNTVLKGLLAPDDHVVVSELEHNCVMRPLDKLKEIGVSFTKAKVFPADNDKTVDSFRKSINSKTALIVCTHASNVFGLRLPIERIASLAHEYAIPMLADVAQSAGVLPIDMKNSGVDFLCVAPHKGLYAPMGTGLLITNKSELISPLTQGGTGTNSAFEQQPDFPPDKFESGTVNVPGIIGIKSGIEFVNKRGRENIFKHEMKLIRQLHRELSKIKKVKLYTPFDMEHFVPVLSFNVENMHSEEVVERLSKRGIALRGGLHCASSAHTAFNTVSSGTVRVSVSAFNTVRDINVLVNELKKF